MTLTYKHTMKPYIHLHHGLKSIAPNQTQAHTQPNSKHTSLTENLIPLTWSRWRLCGSHTTEIKVKLQFKSVGT